MVRNASKWLSAVLAVVMMISMVSICAFAEEPAAPATDVLYTEDFKINGDTLNADGMNLYSGISVDQTEYALSIEKNVDNSVYVYADKEGKKGEKIGTVGRETQMGVVTVQLPKYLNDFILTLESQDGTVSADYALRIEKGMVIVEGDSLTSEELEDNTMYYSIPYEANSIRFKLNTTGDCTVYCYRDENAEELTAVGGYYTVDFAEPGEVWIELEFAPAVEGEDYIYYGFYLAREANDENELKSVEAAGCTVDQSTETVYTVTVPKGQTAVDLKMTFSAESIVAVVNAYTGEEIEANGSLYSVEYTSNEDEIYGVIVMAQNGDIANYNVVLTRVRSTECQLLDIDGAQPVADGYEVHTDAKAFYVNAIVSPYATYEIYADAECTEAIEDPFIQLTAGKTVVYIMVVAETGYNVSEPVKLTINTTATGLGQSGDDVYYQNFYNLGKVAVTGGIGLIEAEDVTETTGLELNGRGIIYVQGSTIGKKMYFKIEALGEYEPKGVRLYADVNKTILLENAIYLTPDGAGTALYAVIEANGVKEEYLVQIVSEVSYTFNDLKADDWAKEYVEAMGDHGVMNGYPNGSFGGNNKLTRNEMAALMVRLVGANKDLYADVAYKFLDTTADWAVNYVKAATRIGLIDGNPVTNADGDVEGYTFDGERNATRAEFLKVMGNAMLIHTEYTVDELYAELQVLIDLYVYLCEFKDIESVADWAKPYVYTAVFMGWIEGSSEVDGVYLHAESEINRFEVAAIVARANGLVEAEEEPIE